MSRPKTARSDHSRRSVLGLIGAGGAAVLVGLQGGLVSTWAAAAAPAKSGGGDLPHLSDADPTAKALGYTEDAGKVDKAKFPSFKPGAHCGNCNFFQGAAGQQFGPCQIFPGKSVNTAGWCASHSPKQ